MTLIFRMLLVLVQQMNILGNQRLNLLVIVSLGICILGVMCNFGNLYCKRSQGLLETFYIVNLVLLAGWSEYVISSSDNQNKQLIVSYIFISLALLMLMVTAIIYCFNKNIIKMVKMKFKKNDSVERNDGAVLRHPDTHSGVGEENYPAKSTTYLELSDTNLRPLTELLQ